MRVVYRTAAENACNVWANERETHNKYYEKQNCVWEEKNTFTSAWVIHFAWGIILHIVQTVQEEAALTLDA